MSEFAGDNPGAKDPAGVRKEAIALRYAEHDHAPRVVAKGYGDVAEAILSKARAQGLHTHQSPELARLLMRVDLDDHIPPELYRAVAELLAWVFELNSIAQSDPQNGDRGDHPDAADSG